MCPDEPRPARAVRDTRYPLLPLLKDESLAVLVALEQALQNTMPLKAKHREDLPNAVRDLSAMLTTERSGLAGGYLQTPRTLAAYAHYFLPWNVYRQARLFAGQWLRLHSGARILDLGAGPLTGVLALWAARPDLRDKELHFVCVDRSRKALHLGMDVFRAIGGSWRVEMVDQALEVYLRQQGEKADFVLLGNVLNEIRWPTIAPLEETVGELADRVLQRMHLDRKAHVIVMEPGTRFGGKMTALFRKAVVNLGLMALSPCTHQEECPMLERDARTWCHFRFDAAGAPEWLQQLSEQAGLPKEHLALSFVRLGAVQARQADQARVLSGGIRLPERNSVGYYGCTRNGLVLVEPARMALQQGDLVEYVVQPGPQRDSKSGALMASLPGEELDAPPASRDRQDRKAQTDKKSRAPQTDAKKKGSDWESRRKRFESTSGAETPRHRKQRGAVEAESGQQQEWKKHGKGRGRSKG